MSGVKQRIAEPHAKSSLGLQILFAGSLPMDFGAVETSIQSFDHSMADARCELRLAGEGNFVGAARWGNDVVEIVGFGAPMPDAVVKACVAPCAL